MATLLRRSGRKRKATSWLYKDSVDTTDLFSSPEPGSENEALSAGDEYSANGDNNQERESESSLKSAEDANASDEASGVEGSIASEPEKDGVVDNVRRIRSDRRKTQSTSAGELDLHSGRVRHKRLHDASSRDIFQSFGGSVEDNQAWDNVLKEWWNDAILPSRQLNRQNACNIRPSFWRSRLDRNEEQDRSFDRLTKFQRVSKLHQADVENFRTSSHTASFLMGPVTDQKIYTLPYQQSFNVSKAFMNSDVEHTSGTAPHEPERKGWIINLSEPVHCLAWAPQSPNFVSRHQFLAISTLPKSHIDATMGSYFRGGPPLPSQIQIWQVKGDICQGTNFLSVSSSETPKLKQIICSESGYVRNLKWCPQNTEEHNSDAAHLGRLGCVFSDGVLRVIDIRLDEEPTNEPSYVYLTRASFESKPQNTVCTCIEWISEDVIVAGCADGHVAAWDLRKDVQDPQNPEAQLPFFFEILHASYVLTLSAASPARPNILFSSSMDGYVRVTDIRAPDQDFALAPRSRIAYGVIQWLAPIQFLLVADDSNQVKAVNARHMGGSAVVSRHESIPMCMSGGPFHPSVLTGCANGTLDASNPIKRIFDSAKHDTFQQTIFQHEWRRPQLVSNRDELTIDSDEPSQNDDAINLDRTEQVREEELDFPHGLSRFVIGQKPVSFKSWARNPNKGKSTYSVRPNTTLTDQNMTVTYSTIYEEESAVKCCEWNPNLSAGGWAAAGLGSGLLWIEDLCVE